MVCVAKRLYKGLIVDQPINVKESLGKVAFESYRGFFINVAINKANFIGDIMTLINGT